MEIDRYCKKTQKTSLVASFFTIKSLVYMVCTQGESTQYVLGMPGNGKANDRRGVSFVK